MNNAYQIKFLNFEGPLEKVLELIEEKKLEINQLSLALVTEDFLIYIQDLSKKLEKELNNKEYLRILSDFIVIASRLIFIKSKYLLNIKDEQEEKNAKELEYRILWFSKFRDALKVINKLWNKNYIFSRPYLWKKYFDFDVFYPGNLKEINQLFLSIKNILLDFENIYIEEKTLEKTIISLEDKINELLKILKDIKETNFQFLTQNISKTDLIVTFLAILHLAREKFVFLEQKENFSDIIIRKI